MHAQAWRGCCNTLVRLCCGCVLAPVIILNIKWKGVSTLSIISYFHIEYFKTKYIVIVSSSNTIELYCHYLHTKYYKTIWCYINIPTERQSSFFHQFDFKQYKTVIILQIPFPTIFTILFNNNVCFVAQECSISRSLRGLKGKFNYCNLLSQFISLEC